MFRMWLILIHYRIVHLNLEWLIFRAFTKLRSLIARMPQLVSIIMEAGAANNLVEDYAACLETRAEESQAPENPDEDIGSLILRLLLANLEQPAPNVTHLLLKSDVNQLVERTMLQPKRHFSYLRVIVDILDTLPRPEVNAGLHEHGFQLMYELCVDPVTCGPVVELLRGEKYEFFSKHLDTFVCEPLPKRSANQQLRVSSLQQVIHVHTCLIMMSQQQCLLVNGKFISIQLRDHGTLTEG